MCWLHDTSETFHHSHENPVYEYLRDTRYFYCPKHHGDQQNNKLFLITKEMVKLCLKN